MRKLLRFFTSRGFLTIFLMSVQLGLFIWFLVWSSLVSTSLFVTMYLLSLCIVIWIIGRPVPHTYKLIWSVLILAFPMFGGMMYLIWGEKAASHPLSKRLAAIDARTASLLPQNKEAFGALARTDYAISTQARYLYNAAGCPVYERTSTRYLGSGNEKMEYLLKDIAGARRFIFMEYFIIQPGQMWDTVLDALAAKVTEGVEVRFMYDDVGSIMRLPRGYVHTLQARGLQVETFNRLAPQLNLIGNNRDHRKIAVIDGHVAYTGGINFADEYIDIARPFGSDCYFKDSSVRLEGDAAWSFTVFFLRMWEAEHTRRTGESAEGYERYRLHAVPAEADVAECSREAAAADPVAADAGSADEAEMADAGAAKAASSAPLDGFVIPYVDSPLDHEDVGESVYFNLINSAQHTLFMTTPYLVIDDLLVTALILAAKRGVDVRIITPHIPDKKLTFFVTRAHYPRLLAGGVRIYEYTPGFIHSKLAVADGRVGTVGTINLDFRSLFLHFECGAWMYGSEAVGQTQRDIEKLLAQSEELSMEHHYAPKTYLMRVLQALLRLLGPIL